jgi:orotidine 5'-phosphate decarboxylase subfamily 1
MTALLTHKESLLELAETKKSRLVLSADLTKSQELLHLADLLGPKIVCLKTHIDILSDFTPDVTRRLRALADKHHFIIFEDRKFADIGATVQKQFAEGIYRIADWAHLINAHPLPGPGLIEGLKAVQSEATWGCLLLAQMSSKGNLITPEYTQATIALAEKHRDFVLGFISQKRLHPDFLHFTPGVHLASPGDPLGQQYRTPEEAIKRDGCDFIIVGRGITESTDPLKEADRYLSGII